ncbi:MAG TPA: amidase [Solirubrobacteraceae bacterium]|jgi:amidase|nr:amidase [Solirubrobacteraceae bacterium]
MSELMYNAPSKLASMVRSGQLSATELVQDALDAIAASDPIINAFTYVATESALVAAGDIETADPRPFAGVPIAIKDNRPVAGMPTTHCSDLFGDRLARRDAYFVRRLRDAGFVIVGKTAMPEMGILPTTESRRFGPTANPWDVTRTPGGSSGGSAAAVAAGMVPIAHGNDGGGSIRIPAACCGVVGMKAARGRISVGPDSGDSYLTEDGVLTRSVADTAEVLDLIAGYELGDATWAPPPSAPDASYAELARHDPGRLRVGLALNMPLSERPLDPMCRTAVHDCAELLASLGHEVEEIAPPWSGQDLLQEFSRLFGPMVSMTTLVGGRLEGREPLQDDVEPLTWLLYEKALEQSSLSFLRARGELQSLARSIISFTAPYDVVLTPALAKRPLPTGEVHGRGPDPWDHFRRSGEFTPYTAIVNVTGQPAISLPLYHGTDGLPTAVQLIGPPAREEVLLQLASQLEQALPWADRRPAPLG